MRTIKIKRIYDAPAASDGARILVDRLWPRGVSKERAAVDQWQKELAPSTQLRKWFGHDPAKWREFRSRYRRELADKHDALREVKRLKGTVTLVYAARDQEHNGAVVLKEVLKQFNA